MGSVAADTRCALPWPADYHLIYAGCDDCDARRVASYSLEKVEEGYRYGQVRQALFEAYMHVWATGAPRFSHLGDQWTEAPTDPEVAGLVERIREAAAARRQQ
jgi:hypothetical protein